MSNGTLYNKAVIYKALETMPAEQLEALRVLFSSLSWSPKVHADTLSDAEYEECLSIAQNTAEDEWFSLDCIE